METDFWWYFIRRPYLLIVWFTLYNLCYLNVDCTSNIVFVGIFPIHGKGSNPFACGDDILFERGLQRMEAMFFAIDQINAKDDVLKNITIRPKFVDSCDQPYVAVERFVQDSLKMIRGTNQESCPSNVKDPGETLDDLYTGVIGASSSSISLELANLMRLFKVPQISYASTSALLNDRVRYDYFTRTVPPDTQQVIAMLDLAISLGWRSFSIVYSEGTYGESAFEELQRITQRSDDFCLIDKFKVDSNTNFTKIVQALRNARHGSTSVIILFCGVEHVRQFLQALPTGHTFTLLASDAWGTKRDFLSTQHLRAVANGALTFKLRTPKIQDFKNYFLSLDVNNNKRNKWFIEYHDKRAKACDADPRECGVRIVSFDDKVPYVMDAVYALAYSLDEIYREKCHSQSGVCVEMRESIGTRVMEKLYNLTYPSVFGQSKLNENGSANTGYEILRYNGDLHNFKDVAVWNGTVIMLEEFSYVSSVCSVRCSSNERRIPKEGYPPCCYDCEPCGKNHYKANDEYCGSCGSNMRPNATGNGCVSIPIRHLALEWVVVITLLSAIGIVVAILVLLIFYYFKDTEIVRTSAPELSFPLLVGIVLAYSLNFIVVADQTELLCGVRRFCMGFFFSICYSAVLTKTNRLARVFNEKKYSTSHRAPRFLSATSQVVIMFILVFLEGGLALFALYYSPPTVTMSIDEDGNAGILKCPVPYFDAAISIFYNMILLFVSAYYAYRTRKIPACFNEAKHLGMVTYVTILIWICFIPVYVVNVNEDTKLITLSISFFLCATSIVVVLFGPKVYIIIFRPSRNKRTVSMRSFSTSHSQSMDNSESYSRKMTICSAIVSTTGV